MDLRRQAGESPSFPEVIVFTMADPEATARFLESFWPEARAVSDPGQEIYRAFRLRRGNLWQLFGPHVFVAAFRALFKRQAIGRPVGDPLQMPGFFLVEGDRVLWTFVSRHAGHHPDLAALPRTVAEVRP